MKKTLSLIGIFACLTIGSIFIAWCSNTNKVSSWDKVSITYTATLPDWSVFKSTQWNETLDFIVWAWEVIKWLDEWIIGMREWGTKTLKLDPQDAYASDYNQMNIQKVSKTIFDKLNITPKEGEIADLWGIKWIVKWFTKDKDNNDFVLFDINPAYTRQTLTYKIKITNLIKNNTNN